MQIIRPQRVQKHAVYGGTEYGPNQRLLVDGEVARLMWIPGHSAYTGRMSGTKYARSALMLVRDEMALSLRVAFRRQGGRLTDALLGDADVRAAVAGLWGEKVALALQCDATIVPDEVHPD